MKAILAATLGALLLALPSAAGADTVRAFISSGGTDGNPCTRDAPCATWSHAYAVSDPGGVITAVDASDDYGLFPTIDKSVTFDGGPGHAGAITNADAITINGSSARVGLRRLSLDGVRDFNTAFGVPQTSFGVSILAARSVRIEDSRITNWGRAGVRAVASNTPSRLTIIDSVIAGNLGYGVAAAAPTTGATGSVNRATLRNVSLVENDAGGVSAEATGTTGVVVYLYNSLVSDNAADGIRANGARAKVRISNNDVNGNVQGLHVLNGGNILSWGNNRVVDNGVDGAPTVMASPK